MSGYFDALPQGHFRYIIRMMSLQTWLLSLWHIYLASLLMLTQSYKSWLTCCWQCCWKPCSYQSRCEWNRLLLHALLHMFLRWSDVVRLLFYSKSTVVSRDVWSGWHDVILLGCLRSRSHYYTNDWTVTALYMHFK